MYLFVFFLSTFLVCLQGLTCLYVKRIQEALTSTVKFSWFKTWCFFPLMYPFR